MADITTNELSQSYLKLTRKFPNLKTTSNTFVSNLVFFSPLFLVSPISQFVRKHIGQLQEISKEDVYDFCMFASLHKSTHSQFSAVRILSVSESMDHGNPDTLA